MTSECPCFSWVFCVNDLDLDLTIRTNKKIEKSPKLLSPQSEETRGERKERLLEGDSSQRFLTIECHLADGQGPPDQILVKLKGLGVEHEGKVVFGAHGNMVILE